MRKGPSTCNLKSRNQLLIISIAGTQRSSMMPYAMQDITGHSQIEIAISVISTSSIISGKYFSWTASQSSNLLSHRNEMLSGVCRQHHVAVRPMMSQDTKSLDATPKPEPKDEASPEAAGPAAGPVELTAMVKYSLKLRLTR